MTEDKEDPRLPARSPAAEELRSRVARIEGNLQKLVQHEVHSRALLHDELLDRVVKLEVVMADNARTSKLMLAVILVITILVGGAVLLFLGYQSLQFNNTLLAQTRSLSDLKAAIELLKARPLLVGPGGAGLDSTNIKGLSDLVNQILGSENNGLLLNYKVQQELLDELSGKKKRRAGSAPTPGKGK